VASSQYFIETGNDHLGKYRRVTGRTRREVELKASEQLQRWNEQEARARQREAVADAKDYATRRSRTSASSSSIGLARRRSGSCAGATLPSGCPTRCPPLAWCWHRRSTTWREARRARRSPRP
jgi:hypothetical protein